MIRRIRDDVHHGAVVGQDPYWVDPVGHQHLECEQSVRCPVPAALFAAAPECSEVVRWSGLPRDVYCPEISTKSVLFPRFGHREIEAITASLLSSDLGMVG